MAFNQFVLNVIERDDERGEIFPTAEAQPERASLQSPRAASTPLATQGTVESQDHRFLGIFGPRISSII